MIERGEKISKEKIYSTKTETKSAFCSLYLTFSRFLSLYGFLFSFLVLNIMFTKYLIEMNHNCVCLSVCVCVCLNQLQFVFFLPIRGLSPHNYYLSFLIIINLSCKCAIIEEEISKNITWNLQKLLIQFRSRFAFLYLLLDSASYYLHPSFYYSFSLSLSLSHSGINLCAVFWLSSILI